MCVCVFVGPLGCFVYACLFDNVFVDMCARVLACSCVRSFVRSSVRSRGHLLVCPNAIVALRLDVCLHDGWIG